MPSNVELMAQAFHLFWLAEYTEDLPDDIPKSWDDLQPWIQEKGWGHPGGIPVPTLERLIARLRERLDEVDPCGSEIIALNRRMRELGMIKPGDPLFER